MQHIAPVTNQAEWLRTRLAMILERILTVEEMRAALELKQSTYYAQVQNERLLSMENLRTLARNLKINEVHLLLECGLLDVEALVEFYASCVEPGHRPLSLSGALSALAARLPRHDPTKPPL